MKKNNLNFIRTLSLLLLALLTITVFQTGKPGTLNAITLRELSDQIAALTDEEESMVEEIIAVEALIETAKAQILKLDDQISAIEEALKELVMERIGIEKEMENKREELQKRIVFSYKYSRNNVIKILTTSRDINAFMSNIYFLKNIMRSDAELIESLRLNKESYDRNMRKSEEKKKEFNSMMEKKQQEQADLESNLEKGKLLLEQVKGERSEVQSTLAAIRERISRIQPAGVTLTGEWAMTATAYYSGGGGLNGDGITATGLRARKGIVAVDPKVIPLGTLLYIEGYGQAQAADTGGWIKGNRIDLCFDTLEDCYRYGRRKIYVYTIGN